MTSRISASDKVTRSAPLVSRSRIAALISRNVETRRAWPAFIASLRALLISSRNTAMASRKAPVGAGGRARRFRPLPMQTQPQSRSPWDDPKPTALLVLADGTVLEGIGFGAAGHAVGEVCFNTAMTGYRGDPHRSILCRPDHHLHVPPYRQCRHQRRRHRDRQSRGDAGRARRRAAFGDHAAVELPRHAASRPMAEEPRHHRARRPRHPRADRAHPREGHAERGDRPRAIRPLRLDALKREARAWPGLVGMDLVPMVTTAQRFTWDETPWLWGEGYGPARARGISCRRHRLRHQAQHPAPACRQRLRGDGGAGANLRRRYPGAQAGRHFPVERPRRSGRYRRICRAGDPDVDRAEAGVRHLPRPSDARPRASAPRP